MISPFPQPRQGGSCGFAGACVGDKYFWPAFPFCQAGLKGIGFIASGCCEYGLKGTDTQDFRSFIKYLNLFHYSTYTCQFRQTLLIILPGITCV